jgi:hypothetical protein
MNISYTRHRLAIAAGIGLVLVAGPAPAQDAFCSATATALFRACRSEGKGELYTAQAKCTNVSDADERRACFDQARAGRRAADRLCRRQHRARLGACQSLGEERYDPDFDPAVFDDPRAPGHPNPFFPLAVGNRWTYRSRAETVNVQVRDETKAIGGVTCIVVRDRVFEDGELKEDTDDWFATAKDGDVWYCGEEVKDFEGFDGDQPRLPELVGIDGSFKVGRDRDQPGVLFRATPAAGEVYREEFSLGNAEDLAVVLSTTYRFGADPALDRSVPERLAEALCAGDCVVTRNASLLEPGVFERKYYAPGIGLFLEVNPGRGEVVRLTGCNVDPRCASLPAP